MADDNLPPPSRIVREAMQQREDMRTIIQQYATGKAETERLTVRVYRYLKRSEGGERLKEYFLKKRSSYRRSAAARLVTTPLGEDPDPIVDLLASGGLPIVSVTKGTGDSRKAYSYWYNRIRRESPRDLAYVKSREDAPDLTLPDAEERAERPVGDDELFNIRPHELLESISRP